MIIDEYNKFFDVLKSENKLTYQLTIYLDIVKIVEVLIDETYRYSVCKFDFDTMNFDADYTKNIETLMFATSINEVEVGYISQYLKSPISGYVDEKNKLFLEKLDELYTNKDELFLENDRIVYDYILQKMKFAGLHEQYATVILEVYMNYFKVGVWKPSVLIQSLDEIISKKKIILNLKHNELLTKEEEFVYKVFNSKLTDKDYNFKNFKDEFYDICKDSFFEKNFNLKVVNNNPTEESLLYTAYKQSILFLMDKIYLKDNFINSVFKQLRFETKKDFIDDIFQNMFNELKEYTKTI